MQEETAAKSEAFKKLLDDVDRKESIITALDQKLIRLSEELQKERDNSRAQADALKSLNDALSGKDNDMLLGNKKNEELIERKNRIQKECGALRDENKAQAQTLGQLQRENESLKQQYAKLIDDSRGKVDDLRNALKKNSTLLKQVTVRPQSANGR